MEHFSVRVVDSDGDPVSDVGIMIDYGMGSVDKKRTDSDGRTEFYNYNDDPGCIWVHGEDMGSHSLADGKTYSCTI